MPITLTIKGTKEHALKEMEKRNIAPLMLETYQPAGTTGQYVRATIIDTDDNERRVSIWYGDLSQRPENGEVFPNGTLLHYSFGGRGGRPDVAKVEVRS